MSEDSADLENRNDQLIDTLFAPFREMFERELESRIEQAARDAFNQNRSYYLSEVVGLLEDCNADRSLEGSEQTLEGIEWLDIESLSQLRSIVGGRFQKLRTRWVKAGLPLREHRGDKDASYQIDSEGWSELSDWLLEQGYKVRQGTGEDAVIFQIGKF